MDETPTIPPETTIGFFEKDGHRMFTNENAFMLRSEGQEVLRDKNNKEIKGGNKARLSEEGREMLGKTHQKIIVKYPNLRGEVLLTLENGNVLFVPEDVETVEPLEISPKWLIIE